MFTRQCLKGNVLKRIGMRGDVITVQGTTAPCAELLGVKIQIPFYEIADALFDGGVWFVIDIVH